VISTVIVISLRLIALRRLGYDLGRNRVLLPNQPLSTDGKLVAPLLDFPCQPDLYRPKCIGYLERGLPAIDVSEAILWSHLARH